MEYLRRKNGKTAEFLARNSHVLVMKNQEREKRKIPHRQGIHEELMEVWEVKRTSGGKIAARLTENVYGVLISLSVFL